MESRGTGVHAIVPAHHGTKKAIKEIGEKTWRGLRRVREIGEETHPIEAQKTEAKGKGWENLAANDCHEAILKLSERSKRGAPFQSVASECEQIPSEETPQEDAEARENQK